MPSIFIKPNFSSESTHNPPTTNWTVEDTTAHESTSDEVDGTYIESPPMSEENEFSHSFFFEDIDLPETARILAIRHWVRYAKTEPFVAVQLVGRGFERTGTFIETWVTHFFHETTGNEFPHTTFFSQVSPWRTKPSLAQTWWQANEGVNFIINSLTLQLRLVDPFGDSDTVRIQVSDIQIEIDYNEAPETEVLTPQGVVDDTASPQVTWTYNDPENDPHEASEVRIYRLPSGGWPISGLPGSADLVYNTVIIGDTTSHIIEEPLTDGESYRSYVRVRQPWSGSGPAFWSQWEFSEFSIDIEPPDAPTLVLTTEPENARIQIDITPGPDQEAPIPDWYLLHYRDSDNDPWVRIRLTEEQEIGEWLNPPPGHALIADEGEVQIYDHEVPIGKARQYRVRGVWSSPIVEGEVLTGPVTIESVTLESSHWWFKDPFNPELNARVRRNSEAIPIIRSHRAGVFYGLGRSDAVVVSARTTRGLFTFRFVTSDEEEAERVLALIEANRDMLLVGPRFYSYVRFIGESEDLLDVRNDPGIYHEISVELAKIRRP